MSRLSFLWDCHLIRKPVNLQWLLSWFMLCNKKSTESLGFEPKSAIYYCYYNVKNGFKDLSGHQMMPTAEFNTFLTFSRIMRTQKMWNASRFCVSSLRRGHANLLCIVPILVYAHPKVDKNRITFIELISDQKIIFI